MSSKLLLPQPGGIPEVPFPHQKVCLKAETNPASATYNREQLVAVRVEAVAVGLLVVAEQELDLGLIARCEIFQVISPK